MKFQVFEAASCLGFSWRTRPSIRTATWRWVPRARPGRILNMNARRTCLASPWLRPPTCATSPRLFFNQVCIFCIVDTMLSIMSHTFSSRRWSYSHRLRKDMCCDQAAFLLSERSTGDVRPRNSGAQDPCKRFPLRSKASSASAK